MKNILLLMLLIAVIYPNPIQAAVYYVPADYPTIQAAVDECDSEYDLVLISPGTYTGTGNRDVMIEGKHVNIRGEGLPMEVVIDIGGADDEPHRAFSIDGQGWAHVNITNLTLKNGHCGSHGGAILAQGVDLLVSNCRFMKNESLGNGGGIALPDYGSGGSLTCYDSSFDSNAGQTGGAIYCHNLVASNCQFGGNNSERGGALGGGGTILVSECYFDQNNSSEEGGAIYSFYYLNVEDSLFQGNSSVFGGSVSVGPGEYARFTGCVFRDNEALEGGGVSVWGSSIDIVNCLFCGNTAAFYGGALEIHGSSFANIWNSTFSLNMVDAKGGAVLLDEGFLEIENSIFWGNSAGEGPELFATNEFFGLYPARMQVNNSLVMKSNCISEGQQVELSFGENIVERSPEFVEPQAADFTLKRHSPCIDNGTGIGAPVKDLLHRDRPAGLAWDIGAYEHQDAYAPGCHLEMTDTELTAGDDFYLGALAVTSESFAEMCLVVALECAGEFYFYPLWTTPFAYELVSIQHKRYSRDVFKMEWPAGAGSISGIRFWGALLDPLDQGLVGDLSHVAWSCY